MLVAPGCAESLWRSPAAAGAGALTTRWARWAPQAAASRWGGSPAGIVFERLPETGFRALLGNERKRWQRAPAPVLLALRGDLDELGEMAQQLERVDGIAGLLIDVIDSTLDAVVAAIRSSTLLPLLTLLPAGGAIEARAQEAAHAGVDALVVRAYPPAAALIDDELVAGVLVGSASGPLTVEAVPWSQGRGRASVGRVRRHRRPCYRPCRARGGRDCDHGRRRAAWRPAAAAWIGASAGVQSLILISANACEMR